jgi:hypothetical protein
VDETGTRLGDVIALALVGGAGVGGTGPLVADPGLAITEEGAVEGIKLGAGAGSTTIVTAGDGWAVALGAVLGAATGWVTLRSTRSPTATPTTATPTAPPIASRRTGCAPAMTPPVPVSDRAGTTTGPASGREASGVRAALAPPVEDPAAPVQPNAET